MHALFNGVLARARENLAPNDFGRVVIHQDRLEAPIVIPIRPLDQLNADTVMSYIENVLNSHANLSIDESFKITIGTIEIPKGSGRVYITNVAEASKEKRSIGYTEQNNTCLARAIAKSWAKLNTVSTTEFCEKYKSKHPDMDILDLILTCKKVPKWYYGKLSDKTRTNLYALAYALHIMTGVPTDYACSLIDIPKFEEFLDIRIFVVSARMGNKFIYIGEENPRRQNVYVWLKENEKGGHFESILNITGFCSNSYICEKCLKAYSNREKHDCEKVCIVCKTKKTVF